MLLYHYWSSHSLQTHTFMNVWLCRGCKGGGRGFMLPGTRLPTSNPYYPSSSTKTLSGHGPKYFFPLPSPERPQTRGLFSTPRIPSSTQTYTRKPIQVSAERRPSTVSSTSVAQPASSYTNMATGLSGHGAGFITPRLCQQGEARCSPAKRQTGEDIRSQQGLGSNSVSW